MNNMLRYVIGISLIVILIMFIRKIFDGKILKKHQYAMWLLIPAYMIAFPFIRINVPLFETDNNLIMQSNTSSDIDVNEFVNEDEQKREVITVGNVMEHVDEFDSIENLQKYGDQTLYHELLVDRAIVNERESGFHNGIIANNGIHEYITRVQSWSAILKTVWLSVAIAIIVALTVYNTGFVAYCKSKRRYIGRDPISGLKIYSIKHRGVPFLLFNKIYVGSSSEVLNEFIICHEAIHYKHYDYIWIILRYIVLALHWYHPIIWIAFFLSGRDCELACDEEVVKTFGVNASKPYVETLYSMMKQKSVSTLGFTVSTGMRGGYRTMKKRVLSIKHPARQSYRALMLCFAVLFVFSSCSLVDPNPSDNDMTVSSDSIETTVGGSGVETQTTANVYQEEITNVFPMSYKNTIRNCTFDIESIDCPEQIVFHSSKVKFLNADYIGFAEEILNGLPYTLFEQTGEIFCTDKEGNFLFAFYPIENQIGFINYKYPYSEAVCEDYESDGYNLNKYSEPRIFDFGTPEECFDKASEMFKKYGIDIKTNASVDTYYLDHELLEKNAWQKDAYGNIVKTRTWTKEDDAYLFVVKQDFQGIPISPTNTYMWPGSFHELSDTNYYIIFNRDGIVNVQPWEQYCEYSMDSTSLKLLTFDELAQNVSDYLTTHSSGSATYTITKAKLFASHELLRSREEEKDVNLYWAVWVKENNNGVVNEYELRFDAVTGERATRFGPQYTT